MANSARQAENKHFLGARKIVVRKKEMETQIACNSVVAVDVKLFQQLDYFCSEYILNSEPMLSVRTT